jgi:hypothetical protein
MTMLVDDIIQICNSQMRQQTLKISFKSVSTLGKLIARTQKREKDDGFWFIIFLAGEESQVLEICKPLKGGERARERDEWQASH